MISLENDEELDPGADRLSRMHSASASKSMNASPAQQPDQQALQKELEALLDGAG